MSRLALLNMMIGFVVISIAASGGIFIAFDLTELFLAGSVSQEFGDDINSWYQILSRSAHGHFNLFGMLHVLLGLTLSYSKLSRRAKCYQSLGLFLATVAMGPGMLWRASIGPSSSFDINGVLIGFGTSCGLIALVTHALGLGLRYFDRGIPRCG